MNTDTFDKKDLEKEFAKDFSSPVFPILGELYLQNKDLDRAKKVCKIGLKHDPENINGYYILAKVYLYNNQLHDAEKLLVTTIKKNPLHINALRLIIELHEQLDVSKKNKLIYLKKLLSIFPDEKNLAKKIINLDNTYQKNQIIREEKYQTNTAIQKKIDFNIQPNMATLTFVEILKTQKHYHEALHVLSIVESKSKESKNTKKIKQELKKLLAALN